MKPQNECPIFSACIFLPSISLSVSVTPKEAEIRHHHLWRLMAGVRVRMDPEEGCPKGVLCPKGVEVGGPSPMVAEGLHPERLYHHYKSECIINR
jgi:hypothetical protein